MSPAGTKSVVMNEGEKNYVCPICNRGFTKMSGLNQHVTKSHTMDEINAIVEEYTHRSQSSQQYQPLPPRPNAIEIITEDPDSSTGISVHHLRIIENVASGDCLFLAILDYMQRREHLFHVTPNKAQELRTAAVYHIQSNFSRFKESITANLENHMPLSTDVTSALEAISSVGVNESRNDTSSSEKSLEQKYADYMSSPGTYGTTSELCALSEVFNFSFYVVQKANDDEYSFYEYGSAEKFANHQTNAMIFLLFTGSADSGHFRLLTSDESSTLPIFPTGKYKRVTDHSTSRVTSICPLALVTNLAAERPPENDDAISEINNEIDGSSTTTTTATNAVLNRAVCNACGFLAKNDRGLKIHLRSHGDTSTAESVKSANTSDFQFDSLNETDLIRKFGELLYKCKCTIPLVRVIQKSVRISVCQELTKVIEHTAKKNDTFAWFRLLSFPHIVLNTISTSCIKDSHRPNIIRHNLATFAKLNDVPSLFNELLRLLSIDLPKKPQSHAEKLLIKIAQRKIGEGDIGGAVRVLCSQEGIAEYSDETIEKLKLKHPHEELDFEEEQIPNLEVFDTSCEQVVNAIKHFPISSSGGIDGLRPRHLKDLISFTCGDSSNKLVAAVAKLVNVIRSGKIIQSMLPVFYGAALIALAKKNGDIRPIAIGLVWRRLAGKIACFSVKDELAQVLSPIQNGFGVKGGAEAIVHAVRAFAQAQHRTPMAVLKFDYKNAFNEILRRHLLREIKIEAPSLFPMMQQAYRCPTDLHYGEIIIESRRGAQQGDPCASVGFCIGMKRLTHSLDSRLNSWFLDDGAIGDEFQVILHDVGKVIDFFNESGLSLNTAKCEVYFINASENDQTDMLQKLNALLPGIKLIDASSFQLLGAPILDEGVSEMLTQGLDKLKTMCKRLPLLDIHPALRVMRSSISSPRFQYILRSSPSFVAMNCLVEIDEFYRSTLEAITNNRITDTSWNQASLPLSFAGLGIRKLVDLAHPAYFSSIHQSQQLSDQILEKLDLKIFDTLVTSRLANYPPALTPTSLPSRSSQKAWDVLRVQSIHGELLSSSGPTDRARILASSTKPSSKWLQAVPSHQLGLLLDNNAARIAVAIRLGTKVCEPHVCICGNLVKSNGHHGLSCNKMIGKYARHAEINKIMSMAFSSAGFPNTREPPGLSRRDGKRPDGLTSYPWSHGRSLIWDVTVVDSVAASYVNQTSKQSGAAADQAERDKHNHYIELKCQYNFTPLAFESFGPVGPETELFLSKLGKLMKRNTGEPRSLDFLMQRISIAIQRGNAISIRNTFCDRSETNVFM